MIFNSTREYHIARKAWNTNNPPLPYSESELASPRFTFLEDMDSEFQGKTGVFFPFALCFYSFRDVIVDNNNDKRPTGIGFAKLLVPHYGPLFILVDDLQGTANGDLCLTKHMEMHVLPAFKFDQDYYYETWVKKTVTENRIETETWLELRDIKTSTLVATSSGVFVQNQTVLTSMKGQFGKNRQQVWDSLAKLRISNGKDYMDPEMSFVIKLPREQVTEIPSWWDASVKRQAAKPSPFEGRFELYNVEMEQDKVRAVVRAGQTAEGPPGFFHGGGAASAVIEVLMNKFPSLQLAKYRVKFRQPIRLNVPFVIEIIQQQGGEWKASILNFERQLLQEITLSEAANNKY